VLEHDVRLGDLCAAAAQAAHLPALQLEPGLEPVLDEVVVTRTAVDRDDGAGGLLGLLVLGHPRIVRDGGGATGGARAARS
jgi:hypothetical protein